MASTRVRTCSFLCMSAGVLAARDLLTLTQRTILFLELLSDGEQFVDALVERVELEIEFCFFGFAMAKL